MAANSARYLDPTFQLSRDWPNRVHEDAEAGDVDAQLYLGHAAIEMNDAGVAAMRWYTAAGNQGNDI